MKIAIVGTGYVGLVKWKLYSVQLELLRMKMAALI